MPQPLITISSLSFSYNDESVFENLTFDIVGNDFIALIGPNGSGKTTLIKILIGLLTSKKGIYQRNISSKEIGYIPQRYQINKNFPATVEELIAMSKEKPVPPQSNEWGSIYPELEIAHLAKKQFIKLSGGEQQRVLIAMALRRCLRLLILDEPTAGIDIKTQQSFYQLLKKLNQNGIAIILATHEINVIPNLVKKILWINHQQCHLGNPVEMKEFLTKMYGFDLTHHYENQDH